MRKLLLMLCLAAISQAGAILVPPGLAVGDTYRIIFVTDSVTYAYDPTGTITYDAAYFNNFVSTEAANNPALAGLGTTWTAIVSARNAAAYANTGLSSTDTTTLFYNTQGQLIATGAFNADAGLFDTGDGLDQHAAAIYDPSGNAIMNYFGTGYAWTGTAPNGSLSFPLGTSSGLAGDSAQTSGGWTQANAFAANQVQFSVYALSGILTVEAPEPSTFWLAGAAALVLLGLRRLSA